MLAAAKAMIDEGRITPEELDRSLTAQLQVDFVAWQQPGRWAAICSPTHVPHSLCALTPVADNWHSDGAVCSGEPQTFQLALTPLRCAAVDALHCACCLPVISSC